MVEIQRGFTLGASRYKFDSGICSLAAGYAQVDTRQDASYYGTWASPSARTIVCFAEGDVITTVCGTDEEFVEQMRGLETWTNDMGYGPLKVDAGMSEELIAQFTKLGLADLLH
jgi:hypothetical protein